MPNENVRLNEITFLRQKREEILLAKQKIQENESPVKSVRDNQMLDFIWLELKLIFTSIRLYGKCKAQGGHIYIDPGVECVICGHEAYKK